jgi:oligoribonuclease
MLVSDLLVWMDCEMTGLDLRRDALIEVAAVVTGADLVPVDAGIDLVIKVGDDVLEGMVDVVRDMHNRSGLTEAVRAATTTLDQAEDQIMDYVTKHIPEPRTTPLCGNSIATDRGFLARDMPRLDAHLHYRMIDVSSIKELCRRWYPRAYFGQPAKGLSHRALEDVLESIRELNFYRHAIFVPQPGPDVDTAKGIANALHAGAGPGPAGSVAPGPAGPGALQPEVPRPGVTRPEAPRPGDLGDPGTGSGA